MRSFPPASDPLGAAHGLRSASRHRGDGDVLEQLAQERLVARW